MQSVAYAADVFIDKKPIKTDTAATVECTTA
jgi:hypothetical protein